MMHILREKNFAFMPKNHSLVKTALNGGFSYFWKDLRHMLLPKKRKCSVATLITFDNNFKLVHDLDFIYHEVLVAEWFCRWPVTRETGVQFPFRMKHFWLFALQKRPFWFHFPQWRENVTSLMYPIMVLEYLPQKLVFLIMNLTKENQ